VFVEHVTYAVMELIYRVAVLAQGRTIAKGAPNALLGDERMKKARLGH